MNLESLLDLQKMAYLIVTLCLCAFLYCYIFHMYRAQKRGERDYEKYARLALDDSLDDEVIEQRKENKGK